MSDPTQTTMDLKSMPLDAAAEVIHFLSEHGDFDRLIATVGEDLSASDVRSMLRELAIEMRRIVAATTPASSGIDKHPHVSRRAKKMITSLSSREEKTLLTAFGILEKR